jgi:hypothetical protein
MSGQRASREVTVKVTLNPAYYQMAGQGRPPRLPVVQPAVITSTESEGGPGTGPVAYVVPWAFADSGSASARLLVAVQLARSLIWSSEVDPGWAV